MKDLLNFGEMLSVHARLSPNRIGARDLERAMTFAQWNERSCRLANALLGLGLAKGDRVAILAYNCVEWCEIFAATAKAGLVALPINFRLVGKEVVTTSPAYCRALCSDLVGLLDLAQAQPDLLVPSGRWIEQASGDSLTIEEGSLYPALHRMEKRGWIDAEWRQTENNRRGKYYALTTEGRRQLKTQSASWLTIVRSVGSVLDTTKQPS